MKYYQKAVSTPGIPYYTYEEMQQDLAALQAEYPAFLQLHSAGRRKRHYRSNSGKYRKQISYSDSGFHACQGIYEYNSDDEPNK